MSKENRKPYRLLKLLALITGLCFVCVVAGVYYFSIQPQYGFLKGFHPRTEGDPYAASGMARSTERYHAAVYSFQGDYADWKKKINDELAIRKPTAADAKSSEGRSTTWLLGKERQTLIPLADHMVVLLEGQWKEGGKLDDPKALVAQKGWLSIATMDAQEADLWTRTKAWVKGLVGR